MKRRTWPVAVCLIVLIATAARSGTIRTIDGKKYEGDVRLENGQIVISPSRTAAVKLELSDLLIGNFKNVDLPRPPPIPPLGSLVESAHAP